LHRLPIGLGEEVEGPGEVVFETREDGYPAAVPSYSGVPAATEPSANYLVPANMVSPPPLASQTRVTSPPSGVSPASRRSAKTRQGISPNRAFDDYFAEGEMKSREQDFAPSRKGTPLPPPPKIGASPSNSGSPAPAVAEATGNVEAVEGEPGPAQEE
jgi:hypothetical protein